MNSLLSSISRSIAHIGHDVVCYSPTHPDLPDHEWRDGVEHIRLRGAERDARNLRNQVKGLPYSARAWKAIKKSDVLSCHLLTSFLFNSTRFANVVTHTVHRDPKPFLSLMSGLDRIYFASPSVEVAAQQLCPGLASKTKTIFNCTDFPDAPPSIPHPERAVKLIYIGRFSRDKGLESLIRGFLIARKDFPQLSLTLVGPQALEMGGEPDFLREMLDLIASEQANNNISIRQPLFDKQALEALLATHHIVCLPSLGGETLNMGVVESLPLAKPALVSDLAANSPLIVDGLTGFRVPKGDAQAWAFRIKNMASLCPSAYQEMALAAFHYGKTNFSADAVAHAYIQDFEAMLRDKKRNKQ